MKRLLTIWAVLMMLAVSAGAQTATVDVSLEQSTNIVQVGDTFDLQLWLRSTTPNVVMHDIELLLDWDPACVSFNGSASTVDGDYDWATAMSGPIPSMDLPMYPHEGTAGENETYTDGDAWIMLYPGFIWLHGMSNPQTDLHAVTLTFTALALTGSTSITVAPDFPTGIQAEWYNWEYNEWTQEWYWRTYVSECSGTMTGATVIVEPIIVEIDIKPGSYPNSINPNASGVIPVAILTTADFDASTVDPETLQLEGTGGARGKGKSGKYGSMEDVDGDGDLDLVVQIENVIEWDLAATEATLTGETYDGFPIQGTDTVNIVPPE